MMFDAFGKFQSFFSFNPEDYFLLTFPITICAILTAAFQLLAVPFLHKVIIPILLVINAVISYNSVFFDIFFF